MKSYYCSFWCRFWSHSYFHTAVWCITGGVRGVYFVGDNKDNAGDEGSFWKCGWMCWTILTARAWADSIALYGYSTVETKTRERFVCRIYMRFSFKFNKKYARNISQMLKFLIFRLEIPLCCIFSFAAVLSVKQYTSSSLNN